MRADHRLIRATTAAFLWSYATDDRIISFIEKDITTQLNSVASKTPNDLFDYIVAGRDVIIQIREFGREDEIDTLQQKIASVGGVDNIFLVGSVANPATAPALAALLRSGSNKLASSKKSVGSFRLRKSADGVI